jgi:hypothetical protein
MNSRQRRKIKRAWKYQVTLGQCGWDKYINAKGWCITHFGKPGYKWTNRYRFSIFYFKKPKEATAFTLRWL